MPSQLVPQKPSAPRARTQAPRRHVVLTPPPEKEDRQPRPRSKSISSVPTLVEEAPHSMPDFGAKRVSFTEAPEIIRFLAVKEEVGKLPGNRRLSSIEEHLVYDQVEQGLRTLVADSRHTIAVVTRLLGE